MPQTTIQVEPNSGVPVYRQIVDQFCFHLHAGALVAGDQLPSVRTLAAQPGVHFDTTAQAYRELAEEVWIDVASGRRAMVLSRGEWQSTYKNNTDQLHLRLQHLIAEMLMKGISAATIMRAIGVLYFNPEDGALWVPKRHGLGYTMNFGRPLSWLIMACLVSLALVPPIILHIARR